MLCEKCGQAAATVHMTDIVNKKKSQRNLCDGCYKESDFGLPFSAMNLAGLLAKPAPLATPLDIKLFLGELLAGSLSGKRCDECGTTLEDIQKRGTLGCAKDYEVFADELEGLLAKLHGSTTHVGKVPRDFEAGLAREHQIALLNGELRGAVDAERFEEAARLRDRIRALEKNRERQP